MGNNATTFHTSYNETWKSFEANLYFNEDNNFKLVTQYYDSLKTSTETLETYTGTYKIEQEKIILKPTTIERIHQASGFLNGIGGRWRQNGKFYLKEGNWYVDNDVYMWNPGYLPLTTNYQTGVEVCSNDDKFRIELDFQGKDIKDVKKISEVRLLQYFDFYYNRDLTKFSLTLIDPVKDDFYYNRDLKLKKK